MTKPDVDAIAAELEQAAKTLRKFGREALRRAADWQSPLASGGGGLRPKNEVSDPTGNRASALADGGQRKGDPNLEQLRLTAALASAHEAAAQLRFRVLSIAGDALIENGRAGIGTCVDCRRYCTGEKENRVSAYKGTGDPVCATCRGQRDRKAAKTVCPSELTHENVAYRCELMAGHGGRHQVVRQGGGWSWHGTTVEEVA